MPLGWWGEEQASGRQQMGNLFSFAWLFKGSYNGFLKEYLKKYALVGGL